MCISERVFIHTFTDWARDPSSDATHAYRGTPGRTLLAHTPPWPARRAAHDAPPPTAVPTLGPVSTFA